MSKRLLRVIWPFLVAIAMLMVLGGVSVDMLSAARSFVGAESLWAKGEKEASYSLARYAQTHDEADYRDFQRHISIPLGDRKARLELMKPEPDLVLVRAGFVEGNNDPDDIPGMIRLIRHFGGVSFMADAIAIWKQADDHILELANLAQQLHERVAAGDIAEDRLRPLVEQVNATSRRLTPLEVEFSYTLGIASRKTERLLLLAMLFLGAVLVALAFVLARRLFRHNEQVEDALRLSEERLTLAVKGSTDGLWDWDFRTGEGYFSPRVYEMLGYGPDDLAPSYAAFLEALHPDDLQKSHDAVAAHMRNQVPYEVEFRLRAASGAYRWVLSRGQGVRDADGKVVRMAGSLKDIHERTLADIAITRQAARQGLIGAFGQLALKNPPIDDLMAQVVTVVGQGLDAEFCRLLVPGSDDRVMLLKGASGWTRDWVMRPTCDALEETGGRFIPGGRESVVIDDFLLETRFKASAMLSAHGVRSGAELLVCGVNGSHAVLGAYSRAVAHFNQESVNFLRGITNTLASAMDRKVADERLTHMAQFDALTNLPNRSLYLDRLRQAMAQAGREKLSVGVLFADLDRFKLINDSMGHSAGDEVLIQVAQRLQACLRAGDTVGRLGGDEFAIALVNITHAQDAGSVAHKIGDSLSQAFVVKDQRVYVSASVGVSLYPLDGTEPDTLLKNADTAMYRAKALGRNTYQFYLAQMNERAGERMMIETQLRGALERGEFVLHYQPKLQVTSGEISGFEALLRWQHPERGLVQPMDFISVLEDTGLILPVGEWVVAKVCEQIGQWRVDGLRPCPVAVNLSARQFNQKNLDVVIGRILAMNGIGPGLLEIELTESMLMSDPEAAVQMLKNMKACGVRLSVDDFGTGYSSLAYLKRFPLDSLKIDRAFVRDVTTNAGDASIGIAIINLAHSLNLTVVAEGVENAAQFDFLRAHACDEVQGYYFARPMPAAQCTQALVEGWRLPRAG